MLLVIIVPRLEIMQSVRRLGKTPRGIDTDRLQTLRESLATFMAQLNELQHAAGVDVLQATPPSFNDEAEWIDETDVDADNEHLFADDDGTAALQPSNGLIERQILILPSNGNTSASFANIEIKLRKEQAKNKLNRLRELIADKSFQFSHIIRHAPTKTIRTRAQNKVKALNHEINFHCRVYNRCRARMMHLGADSLTLRHFKVLVKSDVASSSAVLNPNIPGGTRMKLSWIWRNSFIAYETADTANEDADADEVLPTALLECM